MKVNCLLRNESSQQNSIIFLRAGQEERLLIKLHEIPKCGYSNQVTQCCTASGAKACSAQATVIEAHRDDHHSRNR